LRCIPTLMKRFAHDFTAKVDRNLAQSTQYR
jgi:hypothetical protein